MAEVNAVKVADRQHAAASTGTVKFAPFFRRGEYRETIEARHDEFGALADRSRCVRADFEGQSVVGELNVRIAQLAQPVVRRGMSQVMRDMREPCTFRFDSVDQRK